MTALPSPRYRSRAAASPRSAAGSALVAAKEGERLAAAEALEAKSAADTEARATARELAAVQARGERDRRSRGLT